MFAFAQMGPQHFAWNQLFALRAAERERASERASERERDRERERERERQRESFLGSRGEVEELY